MLGYTKPLYSAQKQLEYQKHLKRLHKITNKRIASVQSRNTIQQMHKIRDQSFNFRTQQTIDILNHQNQKILDKILQLSKKKSTSNTLAQKNKIIFNNPAKKRRQQQIANQNIQIAQRLLNKQNQSQRSKIFHAIQQYQKIKKTMQHNKRLQILPLIRTQHSVQSRIKSSSLNNRTSITQQK